MCVDQSVSVRNGTHEELVDWLVSIGAARTDAVRTAIAAVDRACFVPPGIAADPYANAPVVLKVDAAGRAVSTISQPTMVVEMLEQLAVASGDRVLEVGTASGYNAALLAQLVGETGLVVSVELDEELAVSAARRLTGCGQVEVVHGDGREGFEARAPYDRIIVTAGASEVASTWHEQLAAGGRLVVPITGADGRGQCLTLDRTDEGFTQRAASPCGFVPLR